MHLWVMTTKEKAGDVVIHQLGRSMSLLMKFFMRHHHGGQMKKLHRHIP